MTTHVQQRLFLIPSVRAVLERFVLPSETGKMTETGKGCGEGGEHEERRASGRVK